MAEDLLIGKTVDFMEQETEIREEGIVLSKIKVSAPNGNIAIDNYTVETNGGLLYIIAADDIITVL